jgi:hypothetical protein
MDALGADVGGKPEPVSGIVAFHTERAIQSPTTMESAQSNRTEDCQVVLATMRGRIRG